MGPPRILEIICIFKNESFPSFPMAENKNKNAGIGIALGACFGVVFGAAYGIISGNISKGTGLRLSIDVFIGALFDFVKDRK